MAGLSMTVRAEGGGFVGPGEEGYEEGRRLFNSDLDRHPVYLAKCRNEEEVGHAVAFAREKGLAISIKSGGHCFIGSSMENGSLVVDLGDMKDQVYDSESEKLQAGAGVKLGSLYARLLAHGRLLPAGSCAGVGLGGLTLGGGYGFFARQWGLTCDHLTRIKMIDGNGTLVDSDGDPDLLWACRGGGNGNFGIITSMEFTTRPAPKTFATQRFTMVGLKAKRAEEVMKAWFQITADLPEPLFCAFVFNGSQITILLTSTYQSSGSAFQKTVAALTSGGFRTKGPLNSPIAQALKRYHGEPGPLPFYNVSGGYYHGYGDIEAAAPLIMEKVLSTPGLIFQINTLGGAIVRGPDSAYPHREYGYLGEIQGYWQRASQRDNLVATVTAVRAAIGAKAHYRNYPDLGLADWESAYYGPSYARLRAIKSRFDPENLIRHAQSVRAVE